MIRNHPINITEARMPSDIEDRYFMYLISRFDEERLNRTLADRIRRQWRHWVSRRSRGLRPHFYPFNAFVQAGMGPRYSKYYRDRLWWKAGNSLRGTKIANFRGLA